MFSCKATTKATVSEISTSYRKFQQQWNKIYKDLLKTTRKKMTFAKLKPNDIATSVTCSIWLSLLPLKTERFSPTQREVFDLI